MMTKKDYELLADTIGPLVWPTNLFEVADELAKANPKFDRDKFMQRAVTAWEEKHRYILETPIDDEIIY